MRRIFNVGRVLVLNTHFFQKFGRLKCSCSALDRADDAL